MLINFESEDKYNPEKIFDRISDISVVEFYLNDKIKPGDLYQCCFHQDKVPSLGFKRMPSGMLIYNCFSCGAKGGVFSFVSKIANLTFHEAVKTVVDTFEGGQDSVFKPKSKVFDKFHEVKPIKIYPYSKPFNIVDIKYWGQFGITLEMLKRYNIVRCSRVFMLGSKSIELTDTNSNPIYCYCFREHFKIYRPLNPTKIGKFFGNVDSFDIQGMAQLPSKGELLIVTSSMKDLLTLTSLGYNAIAPHGEGHAIPEDIVDYLYACFDRIVLLYDADEPGIEYAKKTSEATGFEIVSIPLDYKVKDISDFHKMYGRDECKKLLTNLING